MIDFFNTFSEKTKAFDIFPRSFTPKQEQLILFGPPKSGKTSMALDLARQCKNPIFIDCADIRLDISNTQQMLVKLFLEKKLDCLIVDNFSSKLPLPNTQRTIITTNSPTHIPSKIKERFTLQKILPLSFEEYVSFSKKQISIESMFSIFLKVGNLPEMSSIKDFKILERNQEIMSLHLKEHNAIFSMLLSYQSRHFSVHNLYVYIKSKLKISKDTLYRFIQSTIDSGTITLIPSQHPSHLKKLYVYNFALPYFLSPRPNFQAIFENLIFCECQKRFDTNNNSLTSDVFYNDECDFIINDCGYIAMPFASIELINAKLKTIKRAYKCIYIIVIESSEAIQKAVKSSNCRVISFIDFALNKDE